MILNDRNKLFEKVKKELYLKEEMKKKELQTSKASIIKQADNKQQCCINV